MKHKKDFLKLYGLPEDTSLSIEDISSLTNIPAEALYIVYNRGISALEVNNKNSNIKERWAAVRVYSFVMMGKTWETADHDIAEQIGFVEK
jgi:hypothetical protein